MQASPINDVLYDFITVLQSKAEGLIAYQKYIRDAEQQQAPECVALLQKMYEQDTQTVVELQEHVAKMFAMQSNREGMFAKQSDSNVSQAH